MPNETHIKWLLEGKSAWNTKRRSQTFSPDFSFSNIYEIFREACQLDHNGRVRLDGFDLNDANFKGATLKYASLNASTASAATRGSSKTPDASSTTMSGSRVFKRDTSCRIPVSSFEIDHLRPSRPWLRRCLHRSLVGP